jgi:mRNA-degrading endonuclease toxin of MazEF toxin-antitoxin module
VPTPQRGQIIWAEVPDPQGRNPKRRPLIILTATEDIQPDGVVQCVAISSQIDQAPVDAQVALPWHAQGHPRTGLKERSAAVCTWLVQVPLASIDSYGGTVPAAPMLQILQKVAELPGN